LVHALREIGAWHAYGTFATVSRCAAVRCGGSCPGPHARPTDHVSQGNISSLFSAAMSRKTLCAANHTSASPSTDRPTFPGSSSPWRRAHYVLDASRNWPCGTAVSSSSASSSRHCAPSQYSHTQWASRKPGVKYVANPTRTRAGTACVRKIAAANSAWRQHPKNLCCGGRVMVSSRPSRRKRHSRISRT